ncbi:EI24 domain-containing protein [Yoonia sp. I 8.24]|uniref:EI24 domain-containing protein n=1 Tax=Yoonia sp. I 8.24 TaxID=1537229 RepID=UPI001EDDCEE9|nr:EI24 domain-containing protein [Yoonia sp. I 8.24]MCG3267823.1 EI24 domain-containing protein [Yoonia sp. I 8.24]
MIFTSFFRAISQMNDPRFQSVLWRGIGITIALLIGCYAGLLGIIDWLASEPITLPGGAEITWFGDLLGWGSLVLMIVLSVFLMVPVASVITSLFLDEVADAVEAKHFPDLPPTPPVGLFEGLRDTVNFFGILVAANVCAFVLYAFLPFAAVFIFYGMNGYLLGREYFQLAAMRREGRKRAKEMAKRHQGTIWAAGCLMALPLTIPLLNLIIPILGAATFTHLYHALCHREDQASPSG